MRKAFASALAALCFCAPALSAATFESRAIPALPQAAPLVDLRAQLPSLLPAFPEPAKLDALMARAADLQISAMPAQEQRLAQPQAQAPAAPQFMAALERTLKPFSADDIRNMPAADLESLARRIMDGAAAQSVSNTAIPEYSPADMSLPSLAPAAALSATPRPGVPAAQRSLYLLSTPLKVSAELGPVAKAVHYVFEIGFHVVKALLLLKAGVPAAAVGAEFAFSMAKAPAMIGLQSMADLQARYWFKKLKTLKAVARIPGVERIAVLTGTETHFNKFLASRQDNRGLIFIESAAPLNDAAAPGLGRAPGLGKPILIADPKEAKIELSLEVEGVPHASAWTPSLQDLLDRKPIPDDVAAAWRERIREAKKDKPRLKRFFDFELERSLLIRADLIDPSGLRLPMGALAQGSSAKRLLGVTRLDQAMRALKLALSPAPKQVKNALPKPPDFYRRSIPLSDTAVERGASPARWRDWPARLWRKIAGRLIIVRQSE